MKRWLLLIIASLCPILLMGTPPVDPFLLDDEKNVVINVNNRPLATVNGKTITVFDVMKKMDIHFYQTFPQYTSSKQARYQFYMANWKAVLQDLISKELVLADAEEHKLIVNNGDVRQEMEKMFGPNIIFNLDKVGMTLDEAWRIVKTDIMLRRMMMARVNAKVIRHVYPKVIKEAYEEYVASFPRSQDWVYQLISIRDVNETDAQNLSQKVHELLTKERVPMESLQDVVKEKGFLSETATINISKEIKQKETELSPNYKEVLAKMSPLTYSEPTQQKSRKELGALFRIFFLKEKVFYEPSTFQEMGNKIQDRLLEEELQKETNIYLKRLKVRYAVSEASFLSDEKSDFQPFVLIGQ